jgi:copper oxidase (laccase) domain-containing protein
MLLNVFAQSSDLPTNSNTRDSTNTHARVATFCSGRNESLATIKSMKAEAMSEGFADTAFIEMEQVHAAKFTVVEEVKELRVSGVDALLTSLPNVTLVVRTADCLPVLLYYSGAKPLIGVVHAGRKSTELGLLKKVLTAVKTQFGINKGLKLWFGPAICRNCYQIDRQTDLHYDLIEENLKQIREVFGPSEAQVNQSKICTVCKNSQWYSYRQEGVGVKMNYSGIVLKI